MKSTYTIVLALVVSWLLPAAASADGDVVLWIRPTGVHSVDSLTTGPIEAAIAIGGDVVGFGPRGEVGVRRPALATGALTEKVGDLPVSVEERGPLPETISRRLIFDVSRSEKSLDDLEEQLVPADSAFRGSIERLDESNLLLTLDEPIKTNVLAELILATVVVEPQVAAPRFMSVARPLWPNDPLAVPSSQSYIRAIYADLAWRVLYPQTGGPTLQAPLVAVLDTGIQRDHEDFANKTICALDADGRPLKYDTVGHGTQMAGVIAAEGNNGLGIAGVAWKSADLMSVQVTKNAAPDTVLAAKAIRLAIQNNADVICISWFLHADSPKVRLALRDAEQARSGLGIPVICTAGNSRQAAGDNNDSIPVYPCSYAGRAWGLTNVIATMGCDPKGNWHSGSRFGAGSIHLAAPFSGIGTTTITTSRYDSFSSASHANAIVAGAVALTLSHPDLSAIPALDLRNLLIAKSSNAGRPTNLGRHCIAGRPMQLSFLQGAMNTGFGYRQVTGVLARDIGGAITLTSRTGSTLPVDGENVPPALRTLLPEPGKSSNESTIGIFMFSSKSEAILTSIH